MSIKDDKIMYLVTVAVYHIQHKSTIRKTAKVFNIPKSTLHEMLCYKLRRINRGLYEQYRQLSIENIKNNKFGV